MRRYLHQQQENLQNAPGLRMLICWLWRAVSLLAGLSICLSHASAQMQSSGCDSGYRRLGREELKQIFRDHQEWLRKWGLATTIGPPTKIPLGAQSDPLRADFSCMDLGDDTFFDGLARADLRFAEFQSAILNGQSLIGGNFIGANFFGAKLLDVKLQAADVRWAIMYLADVDRLQMSYAKVAGLVFEPSSSSKLPEDMSETFGYQYLQFYNSPAALIALREQYRKIGRRDVERGMTHAIQSAITSNAFRNGDYLTAVSRYVAWEIPTSYDLAPTRALAILVALIFFFAPLYYFAMRSRSDSKIWIVLPKDRIGGSGIEVMERLRVSSWERVRFALQFSLYSAFQLGWRDLNVGSWLSRLQSQEYLLRGSGWVRTLSGVQSLLSVYLLAMWALTQFGRLFEG